LNRGFTLIEMVITLAVAMILIAIAVPSFTSLIASNRLTTAVNEMVDASNVARMEAIKRNTSTQLCSDSATINTTDAWGTLCGTSTGAIVAMNGTTAILVRAAPAGLTMPIQLSGDLQALRYNAQGIASAVGSSAPYGGKVAVICTTSISKNNQATITMTAGSVLVVSLSSGACP